MQWLVHQKSARHRLASGSVSSRKLFSGPCCPCGQYCAWQPRTQWSPAMPTRAGLCETEAQRVATRGGRGAAWTCSRGSSWGQMVWGLLTSAWEVPLACRRGTSTRQAGVTKTALGFSQRSAANFHPRTAPCTPGGCPCV